MRGNSWEIWGFAPMLQQGPGPEMAVVLPHAPLVRKQLNRVPQWAELFPPMGTVR